MTVRKKSKAKASEALHESAADRTNASTSVQPVLSPDASRQIIHELHVHQSELEMQNEELRGAQAELAAARARYFDLYDRAPVGYFTLSKQGLILDANLTAVILLSATRNDLVKQPITGFILNEDQYIYHLRRNQLFESGQPQDCELRMLKKDGSIFWAKWDASAARDADGTPVCRVVLSDITGLKSMEDELRIKNRVFDESLSANSIADPSGNITAVNGAFLRLWGYRVRSDVIGRSVQHFFNDPGEAVAIIKVLETIGQWAGDFTAKKMDGSSFIAQGLATVVRDDSGKIIGFQSSVADITGRRRMEEELNHSEKALKRQNNLFASLLKNLSVGVFMVDVPSGKPLLANEAACKLLGREILPDASRQNLSEVYKAFKTGSGEPYPPDKMPIVMGMNGKMSHVDDMTVKRPDGTEINLEIFGSPVTDDQGHIWASLVSFIDITKRQQAESAHKCLEEELRQAQKLEAVGQLAGGVAHDFNNLLMSIMCYADLCREQLPPDHPIREWLDEIINDAQRSAAITRQLLAFARKQPVVPQILDLNETAAGILKLLRRLISERAKLLLVPGVNLWPVKLDPAQVDQILVNLCVNARDAITGTGKITIETANVILDEAYCSGHAEAVPGSYVLLAVSDDGCGIRKDVLEHIFDPFFTTKGVGKGTGLGLSTVYGIVKQNKGSIDVYSEPGKGTAFKIYLPRFEEKVPEPTAVATVEEVPCGRGETILLVEDDTSVRTACSLMLKALSYNVLTAETPDEALDMTARYPEPVDLLLTDMFTSGMDCRRLAAQIKAVKPGIKVLCMSGSEDAIARRKGILVIAKPFSREELARKVRKALEGK